MVAFLMLFLITLAV